MCVEVRGLIANRTNNSRSMCSLSFCLSVFGHRPSSQPMMLSMHTFPRVHNHMYQAVASINLINGSRGNVRIYGRCVCVCVVMWELLIRHSIILTYPLLGNPFYRISIVYHHLQVHSPLVMVVMVTYLQDVMANARCSADILRRGIAGDIWLRTVCDYSLFLLWLSSDGWSADEQSI